MPISVHCVSCHAKLKVRDDYGGKQISCPKCQTRLAIPKPGAGSRKEEADEDWRESERGHYAKPSSPKKPKPGGV